MRSGQLQGLSGQTPDVNESKPPWLGLFLPREVVGSCLWLCMNRDVRMETWHIQLRTSTSSKLLRLFQRYSS